MTGSDALDDTSDDHERFATEQVAQDRDRTHTSRADIEQSAAQRLVNDLVEAGIVVPVPDERLLVHDPSGRAFESIIQLAVFHRGWAAANERRGITDAADAYRVCVLRDATGVGARRRPYLGENRASDASDLCRLCDSDPTRP